MLVRHVAAMRVPVRLRTLISIARGARDRPVVPALDVKWGAGRGQTDKEV